MHVFHLPTRVLAPDPSQSSIMIDSQICYQNKVLQSSQLIPAIIAFVSGPFVVCNIANMCLIPNPLTIRVAAPWISVNHAV